MKNVLIALTFALTLTACVPSPRPSLWDDDLDKYMQTSGWTSERVPAENYYVIRKNGVDMWRGPMRCGRGCFIPQRFLLPADLEDPATEQFFQDYNQAYQQLVADIAKTIEIQPAPEITD